MMITWAEYGLKIENTSETTESLAIYVSVSEHSYKRNARGSRVAVMDLARRFKAATTEMGAKRLTARARARAGEYRVKEMADSASIETRENTYGNQY